MSNLELVPDPNDFYFDGDTITVGEFTIGVGNRLNSETKKLAFCSKEHGIVEFTLEAGAEAIARLVAKESAA